MFSLNNSKFIWLPFRFIYYFQLTPEGVALVFLSFKGSTQAHFVKTSITTKKFLTLRLKEDNDLNSAISAAQVLSINP